MEPIKVRMTHTKLLATFILLLWSTVESLTTFHNVPPCLNQPGGASSRDIAAAITHNKIHHVFQLCGYGWHHSSSKDLVHWIHHGISLKEWPSGFVVVDPETDELCAGFRGTTGSEIVLRCAKDNTRNSSRTKPFIWSSPETMLPLTFWRFLPLDPFRPFQDVDEQWYVGVALDACNSTKQKGNNSTNCSIGGEIDLWTSPVLRGTNSSWKRVVKPMFISNSTIFGKRIANGEPHEFVTVDFLGNVPTTTTTTTATTTAAATTTTTTSRYRAFFNNPYYARGSTSYFIGTQENGSIFTPVYSSMLDWGEFHILTSPHEKKSIDALNISKNIPFGGRLGMTRTLGSNNGNQVTGGGRRIAIGYISASLNMLAHKPTLFSVQSLPRDLTFSNDSPPLLYQAFVPELKILRNMKKSISTFDTLLTGLGQHVEIYVTFQSDENNHFSNQFELNVLSNENESTRIIVYHNHQVVCINGTKQGAQNSRCGPLPLPYKEITMHAYLDGTIIELIVNNVTAITASVNPINEEVDGIILKKNDNCNMKAEAIIWTLNDA